MQQFNPFQSFKRYLLLSILFLTQSLFAQQTDWQWGIWGNDNCGFASTCDPEVTDMAVDKHGNLYLLSDLHYFNGLLNGQTINGYGGQDILISSFDCEGNYRWHKVIGGSNSDIGVALKTDTLGGIYVSGYVLTYQTDVQFDNDTTIGNTEQSMFLIKYDSVGAYQWMRMPQPDTTTTGTHNPTAVGDMDVAPNGDVYLYTSLAPGVYADGAYAVNNYGIRVLKYNASGAFRLGIPLEIEGIGSTPAESWFSPLQAHFKRNHQTGKYYIAGTYWSRYGTMSI